MQAERKDKLIGAGVTLGVHALIVVVLMLCGFTAPAMQEESGVLLMVGLADGGGDEAPGGGGQPVAQPQPEPQPQPALPPTTPQPPAPEPDLITQADPDAPVIAAAQEEERRRREEEEAARRAKEEAERRRREQEEAKRREAEAIDDLLTGAFGSGSQAQGQGDGTAHGSQGSPQGNSPQGAATGTPGWGTVDLGGRGLSGSLPRPAFDVNASGIVVVNISVDAQGSVIATSVGKGTTTSDRRLRDAAMDAARRARFQARPGTGTQTGTITYRFDSDN